MQTFAPFLNAIYHSVSEETKQQLHIPDEVGLEICIQWNPSIAATVGEWHFGCYTEVAVVEGSRVLGVLVHEKLKKSSIVVCTEVLHVCAHCKLTILFI